MEDAVFLNTKNELACTSVGNLFCWTDSTHLVTPPLSAGILPGITRAKILNLARALNVSVREAAIPQAQLTTVSGAFSTNSLVGLQTLSELEGRPLQSPPAQAALQQAYDTLLTTQR